MKNKQFEEYAFKVIKKYAPILDLNNHTFKLEYGCDSNSSLMECLCVYPYIDAQFNYSDKVVDMWKNKESVVHIILHEMCHLITDPLYNKAVYRYVGKHEIEDEREKLTDVISKLVLKIK